MANDTKYRTLDLFAGIGGISLGLQRWCRTVCYCEIDPYACGVLIKNMVAGNIDVAPIWSDITTLGRTELDAIGRIDCITGGFPCTDISCAGKGKGIIKGETRSGLFFEIVRLIRLVRPRFVFLENVPAITIRGLDTVLGELAESGYNAGWKVLSAAEMGANHKRARWWLLAYAVNSTDNSDSRQASETDSVTSERGATGRSRVLSGAGGNAEVLANTNREYGIWRTEPQLTIGSKRGTRIKPTGGSAEISDTESQTEGGLSIRAKKEIADPGVCCENRGTNNWTVEPDVGRVANGVQFRVDRLKCLGNSVVPQCVEKAFEILYEELL